jgi:hypothetical protein
MFDYFDSLLARSRFSGYLPQPVTLKTINSWLDQFEPRDRSNLRRLLKHITYLSEARVRKILVEQNEALIRRLTAAGLSTEKLIYLQIHDAGSSSPVMLNLLRDAVGLEQRGCNLLDAKNTLGLNEITNKLEEGALIYVDDFVGTGAQFCEARDFAVQYVEGTFSEFLLAPCICEESIYELGKRGVEAFAGHVHYKAERPLHENSSLFDSDAKSRLIELCNLIDPAVGLGFTSMAAMVVLYRNAPDNVPVVLRGSAQQNPYVGIFPRTTDLKLKI